MSKVIFGWFTMGKSQKKAIFILTPRKAFLRSRRLFLRKAFFRPFFFKKELIISPQRRRLDNFRLHPRTPLDRGFSPGTKRTKKKKKRPEKWIFGCTSLRGTKWRQQNFRFPIRCDFIVAGRQKNREFPWVFAALLTSYLRKKSDPDLKNHVSYDLWYGQVSDVFSRAWVAG